MTDRDQCRGGFWEALRPMPPLSVDQWAERHLYLSERTSAIPGLISFGMTPYLRFPLQCFTDPGITTIDFISGTQLGKTVFLFCIIGYITDYAPGPAMIQYPTGDLAKSVSKDRIQPLFTDCEALRRHRTPIADDFQLLKYTLDRMTWLFAWNSMASVSSHPVRYLLKDEVKDTDPEIEAAADDRTKTYANRKIARASSPLHPRDNAWQASGLTRDHDAEAVRIAELGSEAAWRLPIRRWKPRENTSRTVYRYHVPCPHCGHEQELHPDRIAWPIDIAIRQLTGAGWYDCEACDTPIEDHHKPAMIRAGHWHTDNPGSDAVSFHLSSLYSILGTATRFGEIAARYLRTKGNPEKLKATINGYFAWPWEEEEFGVPTLDLAHVVTGAGHLVNQPPPDVKLITIGADVAERHFDWQLWGWGADDQDREGWLIAYGCEPCDMDVDPDYPRQFLNDLRSRTFATCGGIHAVAAAVDSRYRQEEVFKWARAHKWILPIVGIRGETRQPDSLESYIQNVRPIDKGIGGGTKDAKVYTLNTGMLKSTFYNAMTAAPPTLHIPRDIEQWVLDQYDSEKLVHRPGKGHYYVIKRKDEDDAATVQNHQLDAACYARGCLEILAPNAPVSALATRVTAARQPRSTQSRMISKGIQR